MLMCIMHGRSKRQIVEGLFVDIGGITVQIGVVHTAVSENAFFEKSVMCDDLLSTDETPRLL